MSNKRLAGRIALITGASRGIGRAVALALAREGAHVVVLARTVGALEELDDEVRASGGTATLVELDLTKGDKVDALGPSLYQRWDKLDILIGNAAVLGPVSPLAHVTTDAWLNVLEINLTANWRLIRTCDPLLRRSDAGRSIFVGSGVSANPRAYWGPYATSKAALQTLVMTYAQEVQNTPVRVNLIYPGPIRTAMRAKAYPGEDPMTLPAPEEVAPLFVDLALPELEANGQIFEYKTPIKRSG